MVDIQCCSIPMGSMTTMGDMTMGSMSILPYTGNVTATATAAAGTTTSTISTSIKSALGSTSSTVKATGSSATAQSTTPSATSAGGKNEIGFGIWRVQILGIIGPFLMAQFLQ